MATLSVEGVRKSFEKGRVVLEDVSFSAADGEFVTLLGASGCGKSTLLRVIAGLESADSGAVRLDGADVSGLAAKDRDVAMVFQSYALYPHMSVFENIAVGLRLRRCPKAEVEARVREAARMLGLSELLSRRPAALSGGQRQRAALARCLVRRPKLFLLDEPLSNLDAKLRDKTRAELRLLFRRVRGTVVYVTHDQVEAMTLSDKIVVLDAGRIQQVGTPDDIYRRPANAFVAGFLGSPPMNIFDAQAAAAAGLLPGAAGPALAGVRPEELLVCEKPEPGLARAAVALVEPMGAHAVLHLEVAGLSLRALVSGRWDAALREVFVGVPAAAVHFFDPQSGARVN